MSEPALSADASVKRWPGYVIALTLASLGAAILLRLAPPERSATQLAAFAAIAAGVAWLFATQFITRGKLAAAMRWLSINALILGIMIGLVELTLRLAHIDLRALRTRGEDPRKAFPPWAREPDKPLDEVYFQHPGPMEWTGRPLHKVHELKLGTSDVYNQEKEITVSYDKDGFRNPSTLKDWDVALVGDSYTELGYLPADEMISSVIAAQTGVRVKNLGVCDVGLLTESRYLHHFGGAPSCKQAVLVFFEGNDVQDVTEEYKALKQYKATGQRPTRELQPQYSFIAAVMETLSGLRNKPVPQSYQNAWFQHDGKQLPVTMSNMLPLDPKTMTPVQHEALEAGIAAFAAEAKALHLDPLLVYVPFNNRVYHGMIRWTDDLPVEVREWQPNDLAGHMQKLCSQHQLGFFDVTPALRSAAEAGHYVHNQILDTHVNAEGARIIGEAIAQKLVTVSKPAP